MQGREEWTFEEQRLQAWLAIGQVSKQQGQSCLHSHPHQLWTQSLLWTVPNPSKPRIIHVVVLLLIMHFTGREPADNPFMLASTLSTHCTPRYSSIREGQIMYRSDIHMTDAFRWRSTNQQRQISWLWRETPSPQGESSHVKWLINQGIKLGSYHFHQRPPGGRHWTTMNNYGSITRRDGRELDRGNYCSTTLSNCHLPYTWLYSQVVMMSVASMGSVCLFTWSLELILHASHIKLISSDLC